MNRDKMAVPRAPKPVSAPGAGGTRRAVLTAAKALVAALAALLTAAPGAVLAAKLTLADSPLFLSTAVPSNIFFLHDDSGSMDWGIVTTENNGLINLGVCTGVSPSTLAYYYTHPAPGTSSSAIAPATNPYRYVVATEEELSNRGYAAPYGGVWRAWNKDYNRLYYDPDVRYLPWQGVDASGTAFSNAPPTAAPYNPYQPSHGTLNLTVTTSYDQTTDYCPSGGAYSGLFTVTDFYPARYYTWTDTNGDGVVDAGDGHTLYEIRSSGCTSRAGIVATCPTSFTRSSTRTDCTVSGSTATCTAAQELQNFANWFSYHRKRDLTAKKAIGNVIGQAQSESRMGLATLHNSNVDNVGVQQMNAELNVNPKKALLDGLYKVRPSGGTPLRTKFDETGKYFECVSGNIFGLPAGSSSCPIVSAASGGACQQNFAVLVTDGYWNDSFSGLPGTGNTDADGDSPNAAGNTPFDGGAYADGYSHTLGDIAMHYYERDLATNLSNQVPVTAGVDEATHQHMVTYGVAFGVAGTLNAGPSSPTEAFAWPAVSANSSTTIDDLRHAAYNGRGRFLNASKPQDLIASLQNTIGSIGDRTGSAASVAVNSRSLSTTTRLYQARFTSGEWSGDLRALSLAESGNVSTQIWSAKDQLVGQHWDTGRAILTRGSTAGVAFRWTAINASQQADLNDDPATTAVDNDGKGEARLKWLRGDSGNEGTGANLRIRSNGFKLGDIVNSSPIFVGAPPALPDLETKPHSSFRSAYVNRREMVYVGANDGMVHGFDAATGQEKIAYVPSLLFSNLNKLTNPTYSHRYYADAAPTAGDAYGNFTNVSNVCATGCWRTILAGGLGAGGKGVYALDITDPDGAVTAPNGDSGLSTALLKFDEGNASRIGLWEYTDSASGDMGYVHGRPTIANVRNGSNTYDWAVIFGNGYNSDNENAALYIVNAVTGALIRKIVLNPLYSGWGSTGNSNGLSMPAVVDTNGDFVADYVYAGDLRGNLWKIDLTNTNPSNWDSAYKSGNDPRPLFRAVDGGGNEQPITVQPEIGKHPDGQSGYMVYFGTGRYIATSDNQASTSPIQTFYGIWDRGDVSEIPRAKLLQQTIGTATVSSTTVRSVTDNPIGWCTANNTGSCSCPTDGSIGACLGWRDDLLTASAGSEGEKAVSNPVLVGGTLPRIIFTTLIPQTAVCTAGGTSWLMELNPKNGGRLSKQVFDITGDGKVDSADMIGGTVTVAGINPGIGIMPEPTILRDPANKQDLKAMTGSSGAVTTIKNYNVDTTGGRQSWRQLR